MSRAVRRRTSWLQRAIWFAGAMVVCGIAVVAAVWIWARPPAPDAFYDPPASVPTTPGALLRSEPFTRGVPPDARAWRILYTTTRADNEPALASAIVLTSVAPAPEPRPIIAWAHGATGIVQGCAPSLLPDYLVTGGVPALDQVVAQGWVLVATDYAGMGTSGPVPFLIGEGEARSVLDAVRAVQQLDTVQVERRAVVWGHSQGGHAALWTGILASSYAPDIDLLGVAALAPASDMGGLLEAVQTTEIGKMISAYLVQAYSQSYPDVRLDEVVRPAARLVASDLASRCLSRREALVSVVEAMAIRGSLFAIDPTGDNPFAVRLRANTPTRLIAAPVLIAQGASDVLVVPQVQQRYVAARCAAGQRLEYRTYRGRDHMGLVMAGAQLEDDLVAWTLDRLAGVEPQPACQTIAR